MSTVTIRELQGEGYLSPYAGQEVTTRGVVTGVLRRGFFLQTPAKDWDGRGSDAVFVFSADWTVSVGYEVEVEGRCVDYLKDDTAKPVTQIYLHEARVISTRRKKIEPIIIDQDFLPKCNHELALLLNSLEAMLVKVESGQTFIAPSNSFGDYVLALDAKAKDDSILRSADGGAVLDTQNPLRWFPGFRVTNYHFAHRLNLGSKLTTPITGPLNYRVDAYQISVSQAFDFEPHFIQLDKAKIVSSDGSLTVMTLNCFNLDPHVESADLVMNPNQDVDDDWGEGRFHTLAQAIVLQANSPDIVALQEIQDNDGAEISNEVNASDTYGLLIKTIKQLNGIEYHWVDIPPQAGADGGQPGGNIRNGYLYNPNQVDLDQSSVRVFGGDNACFDGSRKPLVCEFIEKSSSQRLAVINIHLASKRHQTSIFSPHGAGVDHKEQTRVAQAKAIRLEAETLNANGINYYITGDFNDTEHSKTLNEMVGEQSANLVMLLPETERYDYNHRGKLQVLMHGIVAKPVVEKGHAEYEIIHGNELIGVEPGKDSDKPSDHAYVLAKLKL